MLVMKTANHVQNFWSELGHEEEIFKRWQKTKQNKTKNPSVWRKLSCVNISFFNFLMRERNWVFFKKAVKVVNECHLSGKVRSNKELVE